MSSKHGVNLKNLKKIHFFILFYIFVALFFWLYCDLCVLVAKNGQILSSYKRIVSQDYDDDETQLGDGNHIPFCILTIFKFLYEVSIILPELWQFPL
jgi:hypothetical protein